MNTSSRIKALETRSSEGVMPEAIELLIMIKAEAGDLSPTPDDLKILECMKQITSFLQV